MEERLKKEQLASLWCPAFSLRPLSAGKRLKIFGEILALRAQPPQTLRMAKLSMLAVKSWWDEGGEGSSLFRACKPPRRLTMIFQREFSPRSSLQLEAPPLPRRSRAAAVRWGGRVCPPAAPRSVR